MPSRYTNVPFFRNLDRLYFSAFEERGVNYIDQYATNTFTSELTPGITVERVYWEVGDRLDKLASRAYGDATYWWVIARYNGRPTDAHFSFGDLVLIPQPLQLMLTKYGV